MRALACLALVAAALGCNAATPDPCKGVAGTCVTLTVQSSTVATVDSLHILASGALSGDQTSSGGRANLPIVVALQLPANTAGSLDLHVDAFLTATLVGSCDTDTLVTPGQHANALCTLLGADNGGMDMSMGGGDDLTGTGPDMLPQPCDPAGVSGPQCHWRWQAPLPQGDDIVSVQAFGDADTFAMSSNGIVLHRDASAWSALAAQPTLLGGGSSLFASGATGSMDLYAAGKDPMFANILYHSPDRGLTWAKETLPVVATSLYRGATTGGYAVLPVGASAVLFRDATNNTWTQQTIPGTGSYYAAAMDFTTEVVVGAVSGSTAAIAYNLGGTWTAVPTGSITPSTEFLNGVCLGPGATKSWWAVGGSVILHATGNSPATWTQQGSGVIAGTLEGCVATDSTHAWAFGVNGAVYVTTDGTTWAGVTTPPATTETLGAGTHSSGAALTIAGTKGVLFRSTNGGSSFAAERSAAQDILTSIYGPTPNNVYAVGEGGAIYTTSNNGAQWTKLVAPTATGTTAVLNAVWAASPTDIYAVGYNGTIVHSSNGTTFTKYAGANAPTATTILLDIWGSTANGVYAIGGDGSGATATRVVLRTTDHGATWAPVPITGFTGTMGSGQVGYSTFALGNDVWVAGDTGLIYHSTDGSTFTVQTTGTTALTTKLRGVAGHIIATLATDPGTYISSTNAGATWSAPTNPVFNDNATQIAFVPDESAIYVFGAFNPPVFSSDKGGTWKPLYTVMEANKMTAAFAFAANDVFIVGQTGIIHYGN